MKVEVEKYFVRSLSMWVVEWWWDSSGQHRYVLQGFSQNSVWGNTYI
jgi:hypothetical protein